MRFICLAAWMPWTMSEKLTLLGGPTVFDRKAWSVWQVAQYCASTRRPWTASLPWQALQAAVVTISRSLAVGVTKPGLTRFVVPFAMSVTGAPPCGFGTVKPLPSWMPIWSCSVEVA